MEPVDCVKNVLRAASQYHNNSARLPYLLHQLEALQNVTCRSSSVRQMATYADQLELAECLTFLVSHIQDNEDETKLSGISIKILFNLSQDNTIRTMLHEMFNLCPSLAEQVELLKDLPEDQILIDSLQLLQRLTYGQRISFDQSYVSGLLKFLINNILAKTETLISPSLGILVNLCRNNLLVQSAIRNMPGFKKLQRTLCSFTEHENQVLVVFSLSVFSSLCLNNENDRKIFFQNNNVEQTLQTIFSIVKNGFHGCAWKYAADMLSDLLRHAQMQKAIEKYKDLSRCLNDLLSLLASSSCDLIAEVFQLLLSICTVPSVRKIINQRLFSPLQKNAITAKAMVDIVQKKSLAVDVEPLLCCIHWSFQESTADNAIGLVALEFMSDSIQDCLYDAESSYPVESLIPTLITLLKKTCQLFNSQNQPSEKSFGLLTNKVIKLVQLLNVMCSSPESKKMMGELVTVEMLSSAIETHLSLNYLTFAGALSEITLDKRKRDESTHCVLVLLEFALQLRKSVPGLGDYLHMVLQNPRLMDFEALGLTSANQDLVTISLRLLTFGLGVQDTHPDLDLCGAIARLNKAKAHLDVSKRPLEDSTPKLCKKSNSVLENKENQFSSLWSNTTVSSKTDMWDQSENSLNSRLQRDEASLQKLISKMETSFEVKKDLKTAEVIDVFEHRIKAQQIKEEHLNDLLEAKSLAVTQADRVIAQLRSQQVTHNAEMKKFQNLLKESYKRNEQMTSQMNEMRMSSEKLQSQFDKHTEEKIEKIDLLMKQNAETVEKCTELEDKIAAYKQEIKSICAMKEDLQVAHEKLNEQYKISCSQSKQLDEERRTLSKYLKEKEASLQKMTSALDALQAKHNSTQKERMELEKEKEEMETYVEELRTNLHGTEKECKELQQTVKMLDQVNQEQSSKLNDKSKRISDLEGELEKHSQIVSFINTLNLKNEVAKK